MIARLFHRLFFDPWERLNREATEERARHPEFDNRPVVVLMLVALVLSLQHYYGDRPTFEAWFPHRQGARYQALESFSWWTGAKVLGYLVVPMLAVKLLGGRLRDYGLGTRGLRRYLWVCGLLLAGVLPVVLLASTRRSFLATYPMYQYAGRSWFDLVAWELMYGASLLSVEFFFRGFLLFSLKRSMGAYAIFVMVVPYCMIHFHKPLAEAVAAIGAGIVLGTLALVTRSIWYGVLVHLVSAWTMDLLALAHTTGMPGSGRFIGG